MHFFRDNVQALSTTERLSIASWDLPVDSRWTSCSSFLPNSFRSASKVLLQNWAVLDVLEVPVLLEELVHSRVLDRLRPSCEHLQMFFRIFGLFSDSLEQFVNKYLPKTTCKQDFKNNTLSNKSLKIVRIHHQTGKKVAAKLFVLQLRISQRSSKTTILPTFPQNNYFGSFVMIVNTIIHYHLNPSNIRSSIRHQLMYNAQPDTTMGFHPTTFVEESCAKMLIV